MLKKSIILILSTHCFILLISINNVFGQRKSTEQRIVDLEKKINVYENKLLHINKISIEQSDLNLNTEQRLKDIETRLDKLENFSNNNNNAINEKIAFTKYFL